MLNATIYLFLLGLLAYFLDSLLRPRQDRDISDVKVWSKLILCTIATLTLRYPVAMLIIAFTVAIANYILSTVSIYERASKIKSL